MRWLTPDPVPYIGVAYHGTSMATWWDIQRRGALEAIDHRDGVQPSRFIWFSTDPEESAGYACKSRRARAREEGRGTGTYKIGRADHAGVVLMTEFDDGGPHAWAPYGGERTRSEASAQWRRENQGREEVIYDRPIAVDRLQVYAYIPAGAPVFSTLKERRPIPGHQARLQARFLGTAVPAVSRVRPVGTLIRPRTRNGPLIGPLIPLKEQLRKTPAKYVGMAYHGTSLEAWREIQRAGGLRPSAKLIWLSSSPRSAALYACKSHQGRAEERSNHLLTASHAEQQGVILAVKFTGAYPWAFEIFEPPRTEVVYDQPIPVEHLGVHAYLAKGAPASDYRKRLPIPPARSRR